MPKIISESKRLQILKSYKHFRQSNPNLQHHNIITILIDIFGVGRSSLQLILRQRPDELKSTTSGKRSKNSHFWNHLARKDLQQLIWQYNSRNQYFTLRDLLNNMKENYEFHGSRTKLYRVVKSMGYKFKLINRRKILFKQKHVVAAKIIFLRKFLQYQNSSEDIQFVYLDETWIYQNGSVVRRWVHETDIKSNPTKFKNEGKRFTILHAGYRGGFLDGCDFLLHSKNNDRDYHATMDGNTFQNWVVNQLIPALAKLSAKCVVIMDNAAYHSVQLDKTPSFSCKKCEMQEWLVKHNVKFNPKLTKKELWALFIPFRSNDKIYVVDDILRKNGHEVLRLPPYHCQYNPIEMAWGFCKTYYNKHINSKQPSKDRVQNLWLESLSKCTSDMRQNFCDHCEKLISDDWTKHMGNLSFETIPPFIISLGESGSEPTSEDLDAGSLD